MKIYFDEYVQKSRSPSRFGTLSRPPFVALRHVGGASARSTSGMDSPSSPKTPDGTHRLKSLRAGAHHHDVTHTNSANLRSDAKGNAFVNQYVVIKDLGRGAFGKVKLCLNTHSNELIALKCINRKLLRRKYAGQGKDKGTTAIKKEIAIMKKMHHENVVKLREVIDDEVGSYIFLALEYVPGGPLYDPQKYEGKGMGEDLARKYFRSTLVGLSYLHRNGIIHRDLKPDNLLKHTDGTVKITDFGVSELFEENSDVDGTPGQGISSPTPSHRTVSQVVGTPAFLAPEIASGGVALGEPSDVWSLGVCLFYIVTGEVPFPGSTVASVLGKIKGRGEGVSGEEGAEAVEDETNSKNEKNTVWIDSVLTSVSAPLRDLLKHVLDKNPESRFDLAQIAEHEWVTREGTEPLDLGLTDLRGEKENSGEVVVSETEVTDSISHQQVGGFHEDNSSVARNKIFKRGEFLIKQGEVGGEMFVILQGEVEVVTLSNGGLIMSKNGDENSEDEEEFDLSDDILAAAMMNRDQLDVGEVTDNDDVSAVGKQSHTKSGGWLRCCFGSDTSEDQSGAGYNHVHRSLPSAHAVIATRGAGDVVGEMSLLSNDSSSTRSASVRATSDTVLTSMISKEELWADLRSKPEVLEEMRLRSVGRESELIKGRALLRTGSRLSMNSEMAP